MAEWTDNKKCMMVWRSGLQYQATIASHAPLDSVLFTVRCFYKSNNAVLQTTGPATLTFKRGKRWISALSPLLAVSERWPAQTITASVRQDSGTPFIDINYDVRVFFTLIVAPNQLVKEVQKLRSFLTETTTALKAA